MKLFKLVMLIALIFGIKDSLQASLRTTISLHDPSRDFSAPYACVRASPCDEENLKDLNDIAATLNLQELNLTGITFKNTPALSNFTTLQTLNLNKSNITDCSSFSTLVNLTNLDLLNSPIKDINGLSRLTNLQFLSLDITEVKDFSPLKPFKNLSIKHSTNTQS